MMDNSKDRIVALVDDDKIFQFTASKTISALEITDKILQFDNGEEALKYLVSNAGIEESLPDYIFLDINMPFVDGWMFLQDFAGLSQNLTKKISIYMVSSSIDPRDIQRARSIPEVTEYITKPVSREKFLELLN
jgi:two-component system, chemotaxis family, chemotaxis protein CheY